MDLPLLVSWKAIRASKKSFIQVTKWSSLQEYLSNFSFLDDETGLPSHPQHELAKRQCYGHSGMITIYIKGGLEEARAFFRALKVFTLAESLGGFESLAELP